MHVPALGLSENTEVGRPTPRTSIDCATSITIFALRSSESAVEIVERASPVALARSAAVIAPRSLMQRTIRASGVRAG